MGRTTGTPTLVALRYDGRSSSMLCDQPSVFAASSAGAPAVLGAVRPMARISAAPGAMSGRGGDKSPAGPGLGGDAAPGTEGRVSAPGRAREARDAART